MMFMTTPHTPRWSFDVRQADWVKGRLGDLLTATVSSVAPTGFEAYARILHPVDTTKHGNRLVRWREVANWGDQTLTSQSDWLSVAMPQQRPKLPRPWSSQGPMKGTLDRDDAQVLAGIARDFTDSPQQCWCCIWDGFGWWARSWLLPPGQTATSQVPSPIPFEAREWPKVQTQYRNYFLYEEALRDSFMDAVEHLEGHSPNLWWPSDHAWCVSTEIDFDSTYVAGSRPFIDAVLDSEGLEAFEVGPEDSTIGQLPEWMAEVVAHAVDEVLSIGHAAVVTSIGRILFELDRPSRLRRGVFRYETDDDGDPRGSGQSPLSNSSDEELRRQLAFQVTYGLRSLAS
jgi:hypothetical protein